MAVGQRDHQYSVLLPVQRNLKAFEAACLDLREKVSVMKRKPDVCAERIVEFIAQEEIIPHLPVALMMLMGTRKLRHDVRKGEHAVQNERLPTRRCVKQKPQTWRHVGQSERGEKELSTRLERQSGSVYDLRPRKQMFEGRKSVVLVVLSARRKWLQLTRTLIDEIAVTNETTDTRKMEQ